MTLATVDWSLLSSQVQVVGFVSAVLGFVARHYWKRIMAEMKPNHGSSMRDAIDRIEKEIKSNRKAVKKLAEKLETHLSDFEE